MNVFHLLQDKGVSEDLFQTPAKLHLTVGVMRLFTPEEVVRLMHRMYQYM